MSATVQTHLEEATEPLLKFRGEEMQNPNFTILVHHYLLGQFRIQLTDVRLPDPDAPEGHGSIVQNLCTYKHGTLASVVTQLRHSKEPLILARSWATPSNNDGDRIRLDMEPRAEGGAR